MDGAQLGKGAYRPTYEGLPGHHSVLGIRPLTHGENAEGEAPSEAAS
jgi:hypothetical protein